MTPTKPRTLADVESELQGARADADQYRLAIEQATYKLAGNLSDEKAVDVIMRAQAKERAASMRVDLLEQERNQALPAAIADGYRAARERADKLAAINELAIADYNAAVEEQARAVAAARAVMQHTGGEVANARRAQGEYIDVRVWQECGEDIDASEAMRRDIQAILTGAV